jgi:hypothetical protein
MHRNCPNKSGIFRVAELILIFLIGVFFQPENKYGIFLGGKINSGIFHARKINTVFIFALDNGWTAGGQSKWTEWTEVCPPWTKKVQ